MLFVWSSLAMVAVLTACSATPKDSQARTPRRDSELAARLVAEGVALIRDGDYADAQRVLERAVQADPFSGTAQNNLGLAFYHQDRLYEAAWRFEHAHRLLPHRIEPLNNLAMVLERAGRLDEAVERYEQALSIESEHPELIGNLARAKVRRGDDGDEMRELLSDLVLRETRPHWRDWAKRELATMGGDATAE